MLLTPSNPHGDGASDGASELLRVAQVVEWGWVGEDVYDTVMSPARRVRCGRWSIPRGGAREGGSTTFRLRRGGETERELELALFGPFFWEGGDDG